MSKIKIASYLYWPLIFTGLCWALAILDYQDPWNEKWGIKPRELEGLFGIIFAPILHKDFNHLINNSIPLLVLGTALFYFYKNLPFKVVFWLIFGGGFWLWTFGRPGNHIGASGLIYGLFSFLMVGGLVSKNRQLIAISFLSILLYGGMVWGVFPFDETISWEGHLMGFVWGIILAFFYKKYIPRQKEVVINDDNSFNEMLYGKDYWKLPEQIEMEEGQNYTSVNYIYTEKKKSDDSGLHPDQ